MFAHHKSLYSISVGLQLLHYAHRAKCSREKIFHFTHSISMSNQTIAIPDLRSVYSTHTHTHTHTHTAVECPSLPVPDSGQTTPTNCSGSSYQDTCWFSCQKGHRLTGQALLTCEGEGRWSAQTPNCQGRKQL